MMAMGCRDNCRSRGGFVSGFRRHDCPSTGLRRLRVWRIEWILYVFERRGCAF